MYLNIQGECYEVTKDNSIMFIGETLIHGLYADVGEDDYFFIPTEAMDEDAVEPLLDALEEEGVKIADLLEYDPEAEPFRYIINALCRYFGREIECLDED
jgi:hypothetical protein